MDGLNEIRKKFHDLKIFKNVRSFFSIIMLFTVKREIRVLISIDYRDSFFFMINSREKCKGPPLRLLFPRVPEVV